MNKNHLRIVQISDIHLLDDKAGELLRVNTNQSFQAVIDHIKQHSAEQIDFIVLSGDISQDGSAGSYHRIAELLTPFDVPVYFVPGNHDYPKVMAQAYPQGNVFTHKHIVQKDWQVILLNSQKPGAVEGYLDKTELDYLRHCLQHYPAQHALILFHHQPTPVGARWLDQLGLTNAEEFWQVTREFPNIRAVVCGHVHQEFSSMINNIQVYATPSTCIQFKRNQDRFGLENLPPGYRCIRLFDDGRLETEVKRIDHYIGVFDIDAKGY